MSISVLLCTEGTYPFSGGGVSTWCDILCRELSEIDYTIYTITANPEVTYSYQPPPTARKLIQIPLWGSHDPAERILPHLSFREIRRRKKATTDALVEAEFVPLLRRFLRGMACDPSEISAHASVIYEIWSYFQRYDWKRSWKSRPAWEAFVEEVMRPYRGREAELAPYEVPSMYDLTTAMRWLYHFMTPLGAPVPKTDIVHTTIAAFGGIPGIVAKHEYGTPFLVTDHGVWIRERYIAASAGEYSFFAKRFLMSLSSFISRANYLYADVVSPVTNFNRRWEIPYGVAAEKIEAIYNGVDPDLFVPAPKPPHRSQRPVVVAAARIFPLKDIETMIRSAAVVRERIPDVHYLVHGSLDADVPYVEKCRALIAELGLVQTFELAGHHDRPAEVYTEGDLTALSSISEAFPYTVLESMSCGRPVVATDVGGVREALEGFGIIVPPRDPEAFGQAVIELLENPGFRFELGRRAREEVLAKYRISFSLEAYRELYHRLAGR